MNGCYLYCSSRAAIEISRDKSLAKQVIQRLPNTAPFWVVGRDELLKVAQLPITFPLFVKPVSVVAVLVLIVTQSFMTSSTENQSFKIAVEYRSDSLVEEYLPGREFSVLS